MKKQIKVAYFPSDTPKGRVLGSNGKSLDRYCIKCEPEEDLSTGNYICDLTFLSNDNIQDLLQEEVILKVLLDYGYEIFRISKVTVGTRYIYVVARQITIADSLTLWLEDVRPTNLNGQGAVSWLLDGAEGKKEIQIVSDIDTIATAYYQRMSLYKALHDNDNSFLNRWGGEFQRRGYTVYINKRIGTDRGFSIREGKNLTGFECSSNIDNLVTRARGEGYNGILGNYINSPLIGSYNRIYTSVIKYDDIKVKGENDEEGYDTLEQAQSELDRRINEEFSKNDIDKIKASYTINFAQLEKTEEYKNYIVAERLFIGDDCRVYIPKLNIDIKVRAMTKKYDVLAQQTKEIKLSNYIEVKPLSIKQVIEKLESIDSAETILQLAKDNATSLIKGGLKNSYVIVRENEVIIGDTKDINTMTNVWRWNNGGLGHSKTGYYGEFGTAITQDGAIVADFITTGILSANLIKAGILKSFNEKTWINMKDGTFNFADKIKFDGDNFVIDLSSEDLTTNESIKELFNNIQIGGRNYIRDYKFQKDDVWKKSRKEAQIDTTQGYGYLSGTTENPFLYQDLETGLIKKDDTLTLQYEVKFDGVSRNTGTKSFLIRTQLTGYSNNNSMVQDIGIFGKHESDGLYLEEGWQKVVKTITITSSAAFDYARFRLYARNFNGTIYFRNIKLEKGSKATDLSPALEDIDSKIEANTTAISAVQGNISTLIKDTTIEKDGREMKLKDAYSSLDQTVGSINTTVSSHTTTISNKEDKNNRIIYARGTGLDYSANRILRIGNKTIYDEGIRGVRVTALIPSTLNVYSSDAYDLHEGGTHETNFLNKINELNNGDYIIIVTSYDNAYIHAETRANVLYKIGGFAPKPSVGGYREAYALIGRSKLGKGNGVEMYIPRTANDKRFAEVSVKVNDNGTFIGVNSSNIGSAIDSVTTEITTTNNRVSSIETNLSSITSSVSSMETSISTIDGNVTNLQSRMESAEQKITPDEIATTVKNHQTNGVNTFATSSDVKQTTDAWVAKFSSKGGYNLIKNGDVTRHRLDFWWLENGANIWHVVKDGYIGIYKHDTSEGFLVSETIKVEPGKTYSFSCQVEAEGATLGADVYFIGSTNNDRYYGWTPKLGGAGAGESNTVEYTFTVPSNINYGFIRLDTNGSTNYSGGFVCWFKHMVLIEGSVPAKTFIPYKNEIYEGNTKIDRNGVKIYNGGLTVINSNGAVTIDASKLMLRILTYGQGSIVIPNGSQTATVTIRHNLGYNPIFKGQIGYINTSGGTEYYSDSLCLFKVSDGTVNYNVRMFVNTTELKIIAWRAKDLINSGTKTFYYRYFIEEGVNL